MTALPAYPSPYSGTIQVMGLASITCGHDYAVLCSIWPNNSGLLGVNNSDR